MGVESGVSLVRVWGDVANTLDRTQHEVCICVCMPID